MKKIIFVGGIVCSETSQLMGWFYNSCRLKVQNFMPLLVASLFLLIFSTQCAFFFPNSWSLSLSTLQVNV